MTFVDRLLPPGFRALAGAAFALLALGALQLAGVFLRDEPFPLTAAALALLLLGGGAALFAFVRWNAARGVAARDLAARSPADWLTAAALSLALGEAVALYWSTGTLFPARMALLWRGALSPERLAEPALPMMLAGTCLLGLGALATAALAGALWLWLYARGDARLQKIARAAVLFGGAVPYVAVALVLRALLCERVALLAAGRQLAVRPDEELAYRSLLALAPGLFAGSIALGLQIARGLWSWLDEVRAAEEATHSFRAAVLRGQRPWQIVLRQGLWLRRRRDLGALLMGGMAGAALIDILSNTLIDSFRPPGFPLAPSLGAALFLRGLTDAGTPLPLDPSWQLAHAAVMLAALLLLLAQTVPRRAGFVGLFGGSLVRAGRRLVQGVASAHGLPPRPAVQWLLGASGAGKSTLLKAWAAQLPGALVVPQDPDEALPAGLTGADVAALARRALPGGDLVLHDLLGRLADERVQRRLHDPYTPLSTLSRGERQRLLLCLSLARLRDDPERTLLLDEPTSGQDAARTRALLDCLRELLPMHFAGSGSLVLATHDPEAALSLLGDRGPQAVVDEVLWLEGGRAHRFAVRVEARERRWEGGPRPAGLASYLDALDSMQAADRARPLPARPGGDGLRLLPPELRIGGRRFATSPDARLRGGELCVLSAPSGSGKSTLLEELAFAPRARASLGYVTQEMARAHPAETPVREALGVGRLALPARELVQRWFGADLTDELLARPIGALSEGERQRVLLASEVLRLERAPADALRVLLLDEPFGALDPPAHLRLMDALLGWLKASQGRAAALLVTHSPKLDLGLAGAFGVPAIEWTIGGVA